MTQRRLQKENKNNSLVRQMTQLLLIVCSLSAVCATVSAQAKVRCADSVQEYENRIRQQRQALQAQAKRTGQVWGTSPETTKAALESYLNRQISTREIDLKIAVSIYSKNPDFLQIDLDARSIPISVPDGEAKVTIEFKRSTRDSVNTTYTIPVCTGKLNQAWKQKPLGVMELRLDSFVASPVTYTIPNVNILVNTEDSQRGIDLLGEFAAQQEEAKLIKELAKEAYDKQGAANVPECQVDGKWKVEDLVSRSDAIVLAKARRAMVAAPGSAAQNQVEFEIMKVVKGDYSAPTLALLGDIRKGKVFVPDYLDCVPVTYAVGQEYLLFLKRVGEKMDLLWYPTAPVNNRVINKDDTWVTEVGRLVPKTPKP